MDMPKTILFSPGDSRRKISKGFRSTADALLLDLEDAVAETMKDQAREVIAQAVNEQRASDKGVFVRVNGWSTGLTENDLASLAEVPVDGIVLPKAESAEDMKRLGEAAKKIGKPELALYALIESARGLIHAPEIAAAAGVRGLMFGGEDFLASIDGKQTAGRREILYARSAIVTAARAYGVEAIDTIFIRLDDYEGLEREAREARSLGFSGKLCVHPDQIESVRRAFEPTADEVVLARAIVSAYEEHSRHGVGVFSFEGRMIDEAVVRQMRQLL